MSMFISFMYIFSKFKYPKQAWEIFQIAYEKKDVT
jgi:hypothetical protein